MRLRCWVGYVCLLTPALAAAAGPCEPPNPSRAGLRQRDGYVDFIPANDLAPFKQALPQVADAETQAILQSADTMWYDEGSMVFAYQDSVETVVGERANCVGRKVGERNQDNPQIAKLLTLFGPDYRFLFPFRKAAGTDNVDNSKVFNFWSPPRQKGAALPVKYWRNADRGHFYWVFPVGTVIGEVLYEQGPQGWKVFEIRTRKRYLDGWAVNLFRPFLTAEALAQAIIARRPGWQQDSNLTAFVQSLRNSGTLVAHRWESTAYAKAFTPIDGALDPLPAITDLGLVTDLLTQTPFVSAEGAIWKENGALQTYGPSSQAAYSIVPKGYEMGMIPVNEVSCNRCHSETSHNLGDFEFDAILYGEVWGEDHIFTWHPFQPNRYIYDTWDEADVPTRTVNPKLAQAGLVKNEKVAAPDSLYKQLPDAFVPDSSRGIK